MITISAAKKQSKDTLIKTIHKKYGVTLDYTSDATLYKSLKNKGLPSLSKLLQLGKTETVKHAR
ncbi:MAG: hypothetical protein RJB39_87 [Candidatus Parcubacteria bacterium]|jgi:DNA-binding phage protein